MTFCVQSMDFEDSVKYALEVPSESSGKPASSSVEPTRSTVDELPNSSIEAPGPTVSELSSSSNKPLAKIVARKLSLLLLNCEKLSAYLSFQILFHVTITVLCVLEFRL
jgi:hypothetical protein